MSWDKSDTDLSTIQERSSDPHAESAAIRMYERIAELEAKLEALKNPWISVEDRLPDRDADVLVMTNKKGERVAYQDEDGWFDSYSHLTFGLHGEKHFKHNVTHWMPIPPTQETEK